MKNKYSDRSWRSKMRISKCRGYSFESIVRGWGSCDAETEAEAEALRLKMAMGIKMVPAWREMKYRHRSCCCYIVMWGGEGWSHHVITYDHGPTKDPRRRDQKDSSNWNCELVIEWLKAKGLLFWGTTQANKWVVDHFVTSIARRWWSKEAGW